MQECILRHEKCCDHNKIFRQSTCLSIGIVKPWKQWCHHKHHGCHAGTAEHRECDHLVVRISGFLHLTCPQKLSYNNGYRISKCDKYDIKYIVDGIGNI